MIGDNIKTRRINKGMSRPDVQRLTGIKPQQLYRYETGKTTNISSDVLIKLVKALGGKVSVTGKGLRWVG